MKCGFCKSKNRASNPFCDHCRAEFLAYRDYDKMFVRLLIDLLMLGPFVYIGLKYFDHHVPISPLVFLILIIILADKRSIRIVG